MASSSLTDLTEQLLVFLSALFKLNKCKTNRSLTFKRKYLFAFRHALPNSNQGNYYQLIQRVDYRTVFCLTHGVLFCLDCQPTNHVSI